MSLYNCNLSMILYHPRQDRVVWLMGVFRLFRWTKVFDLHAESSLAPQWIFLPGLPFHMYKTDCLQILAMRFGHYLGINNATLNKTRATRARLCVEVDLKEEPIKGFPIVVSTNRTIWQEAWYEKIGFYYTKCCRQGHTKMVCRVGETQCKIGGEPSNHT